MKNLGFIGGNVNPCLYVKKSAMGAVYVALYMDNNLMEDNMVAIDDATSALKSIELVLKIMEGLQDFFFCKIKISNDKKRAWLGQPHLIKNMEENLVSKCRMFGVTRLQVCLSF